MSERIPVPKTQRFAIFNRDGFTCQYCGQKPPAVVLELDHIIAVANGGSNDDHNLTTACFDCNRGKGKRALGAAPLDLASRAELIRERQEQVQAYEKAMADERAWLESQVDDVAAVYEAAYPDWTLSDNARRSVRQFLGKLPPSEVIEAMELAVSRMTQARAFRYFCGVCWKKIRGE